MRLKEARSVDNAENVFLGHDDECLAIDLDFGSRIGREEDGVALLDCEWHVLAGVLVEDSRTECHDLALLWLVFRSFWNEDSRICFGLSLVALDDYFVSEWSNFHVCITFLLKTVVEKPDELDWIKLNFVKLNLRLKMGLTCCWPMTCVVPLDDSTKSLQH